MNRNLPRGLLVCALLVASSLCLCLRADDEEAGFKPLFNGENLAGWDGNPKFWRVDGGAITGQTTADNPTHGNTFLIWRNGDVDDFVLRLQYRIVGGNSGVQIRSFTNEGDWGKWVVGGYQADIEAGDTWSGTLYGERYRGVLAARGQKTVIGDDHKSKVVGSVGDSAAIQAGIHKEDWNDYEITARGNHFVLKINGMVTSDCTDEDTGMRRRSGILALQLHAGAPMEVQFRNIRMKRLPLGDVKKIVLIAGTPSHGWGAHEHNAGMMLLGKLLNENVPSVLATVYRSGWPYPAHPKAGGDPGDPTALDNADAIAVYSDGGPGHPIIPHLDEVGRLMEKGVGLACLHYAVEVPKGPAGNAFVDWIGGYFETEWSVNPHWTIEHPHLAADHPITRGVKPFEIRDEWYFFMRFRPHMEGVTPILSAVAPPETMSRPDGTHSGNPHVRESVKRGDQQILAWAATRPDGGRGFGFTGGHDHFNWGNDNFRKLVLNALVWISKADVPPDGVPSATPTRAELEANQDEPKP